MYYSILALICVLFSSIGFAQNKQEMPQNVKNVRAFTKLYGYVRFFYPGDEAAKMDWNAFAVYGSGIVKNAKDDNELEKKLKELFLPFAPDIQIYKKREKPLALFVPKDVSGLKVTAWEHFGVGISDQRNIYYSRRVNLKNSAANVDSEYAAALDSLPPKTTPVAGQFVDKELLPNLFCRIPVSLYCNGEKTIGKDPDLPKIKEINKNLPKFNSYNFIPVSISVSAKDYKGKDIKLKAFGRYEGDNGQTQFWLRVDKKDNSVGFFDNMQDRPIKSAQWAEYEISGKVDDDAERIVFGGMLIGSGTSFMDEFSLSFKNDKGEWQQIPFDNPGFEQADKDGNPEGWWYQQNYPVSLSDKNPAKGTKCIVIKNNIPSLETEDVRLGDVVFLWNVIQHFFPYFDEVKPDWESELNYGIQQAFINKTGMDFLKTLWKMTAKLKDGHININNTNCLETGSVPLYLDYVENKIVIISSLDKQFKRGDVILSIDGVPSEKELERVEQYVSGSPQFARYKSFNNILTSWGSGEKDSKVKIRVKRDNEELTYETKRIEKYEHYNNEPEKSIPFLKEHAKGVYYINISNLDSNEYNKRIDELAKAKGLIFDMRGYPFTEEAFNIYTHLINQPVKSARWNIPVNALPDREKVIWDEERWDAQPQNPKFNGKVVFITDGQAISAAETVMGIIEHYKLADIVGQPTAGTNGNVNMLNLPSGTYFMFTGMKVIKHDGSQHHITGIQPTYRVERTIKAVKEGRDEFLEKALEIINGKAE